MTSPRFWPGSRKPAPVAPAPQWRGLAPLWLAAALAGFSLVTGTAAACTLPAFPGAEGAGACATGGRGGRVNIVTTLAESGPGSLREAIDSEGARTIVFRVDGAIHLTRPLIVRHGQLTIAGQSAPGDGIVLRDHPLVIAADDVVVRYIRSRLGDESGAEADALSITRGQRIILDHVSASWSIDETLSVAGARDAGVDGGPRDVTVQWSIISESLDRSRHAKGAHGYGTLVRASGGARISFHHNLWAHHRARGPRPGNYLTPDIDPVGPQIEFRSNVFYNWGGAFSGYDADSGARITYAFVDNAYVRGPNSTGAMAFREENSGARAYFAGNSMDGAVPADPWSLVNGAGSAGYRLSSAPAISAIVGENPASAFARVLESAGASHRRDAVDARVVADVRARTGRHIDSQAQVGGWPELRSAAPPLDSDADGMPDTWERAHALDPTDTNDAANDRDGNGYTALEDYLNGLVSAPASRRPQE